MKHFIFGAMLIAQVSVVADVVADDKGGINLGGLLKVDKDGNVDMGFGDTRLKVEGGKVKMGTSGADLKVDGGDVDINAGGTQLDVNGSDSNVSAENSRQDYKEKRISKKRDRKLVSDGVFFDTKGKARKINSGDFSRIKMNDMELPNHNFKGADFSWSKISNVNFSGSDLAGADFSRTTLEDVNFSDVDLTGVDLSWATFINVNFSNAIIIGANFERTGFTNVNFSNALVNGSCFAWNKFNTVQMVNVDLTDSVFERYRFLNVDFSGTNKGVAVWDADDCDGIENYAKRANIADAKNKALSSTNSAAVAAAAATSFSVARRKELIEASSIVEKLSEGVGTKIDLTVNFRTDSDQLFGNAHAQVAEIAKALKSESLNSARVMIEGHTDSEGADDYNVDLSYRRAATVQSVLVKDYDVELELLTIKGFGEDQPVASNELSSGRALNRRVTLVRL